VRANWEWWSIVYLRRLPTFGFDFDVDFDFDFDFNNVEPGFKIFRKNIVSVYLEFTRKQELQEMKTRHRSMLTAAKRYLESLRTVEMVENAEPGMLL